MPEQGSHSAPPRRGASGAYPAGAGSGQLGPSHGETEPWRFTVYTGKGRCGLGEAFAAAYQKDAECEGNFKKSSFLGQRERVWISLGLEPALGPDGSLKRGLEEEIMALACAKFVGLTAPHSRLFGFFVLGYPNIPWPNGERRPLEEKFHWVRQ